MKRIYLALISLIFVFICYIYSYAQMEGLHGDILEQRNGVHAGNQFRITLYNDGMLGGNQVPPDYFGEWPINSGTQYLRDGNIFVGSEVIDREGVLKHIISTNPRNRAADDPSAGDTGPNGENWTFLPLRGFASPDTNKLAMSKWKFSWPYFWPDKADDPVDAGWAGSWNGYFGKNMFNADEESYYVADDYANREFNFYPDKLDSNRRGLGIRLYFRGFQWSNALVEDALFILYDLENIGTHEHDKMVFGYKVGNNLGDTSTTGGDGNDDCGEYDKDNDIAFLYDYDDIGAGGWTPVGYIGGAFLESPGNQFDGIDNDGDGMNGPGIIITEDMMLPKTLNVGNDIILTDYITFERHKEKMPNDTIKVQYQDLVFKFWPGKEIEEIPFNLVDDNLNGIIDESNGATFGTPPNEITTYLYVGLKCVDYFSGEGRNNLLLDEARNDGIDNDGDWDFKADDVGADGVAFTNDIGEGDGRPTFGEPHFDKTDIDETDMLGLTSFTLYFWPDIPRYQDELVWEAIRPGYFDDLLQNNNTELLYGSGYFPMKPGQIERFSMGIILGENRDDFYENASWVAKAYNENYNFSKAPNIPTLTAVPGDGRVTLYWDDFAEKSEDPITGKDFEGYRIYRSTDPGWNDMLGITDGQGSVTYRKPIVQFDLDNEYSEYATNYIKGVHFWLGENTGLQHSWVDTTVDNGFTYYYAVTSYDHGDPTKGIPPSECSKFISVNMSGEIDKGSNVAIVRPEAPVAGYVGARLADGRLLPGGTATGSINYEIVDQTIIQDRHTYQITFEDSLAAYRSIPDTLYTKNLTLVDITNSAKPEILLNKNPLVKTGDMLPMTHGFRLQLQNEPVLAPDLERSHWSRPDIYAFDASVYSFQDAPTYPHACDFRIEFGQVGLDTSISYLRGRTAVDSKAVNFTIKKISTGEKIKFGFREQDGDGGMFTAYSDRNRTDEIILFNELNDSLIASWQITFILSDDDSVRNNPEVGDFLEIYLFKPFLSQDVYQFETYAPAMDAKLAENQLSNVKVVPNPYVVSNSWEPRNPYTNGRGPRELHFIHLPQKCTIKIFNIRGQLVVELEHESELWDGTEIWNMQTKDLLDVAYGVYVYHIDAPGIGEKIGKFAVIK